MTFVVTSPPAEEPVSVAEAKAHLRVTGTDDDVYISSLITAARQYAENFLGRALVTQTIAQKLDDFPSSRSIILVRPPLQSVTSVSYLDIDGNSQVFSSSNYIVNTSSTPGRVTLDVAKSWPTGVKNIPEAVTVTFVAGYGAAGAVPEQIRQGLLMHIADLYEVRGSIKFVGASGAERIPSPSHPLYWQERVYC